MLRRDVIKWSLFASVAGISGALWAKPEQGKHYRVVADQARVRRYEKSKADKRVNELFYYGCSHCYNLEPSLHDWLKTKPAAVGFERIPAVLNNPNWIFMAKVYYTAQELGIIEQSHLAFFHALHRDKQPLFNLEAIAKFHSQFGVSEKAFIDTFNGFMVDSQIRRASELTQAYGVDGVPSLVVNGEFLTDLPMNANQPEALWQTVNQLIGQSA